MEKSKNILICPLEWGLGHAARMIPVARCFQELGHNVYIAAGEDHLSIFRRELTGLKYISFPGFRVSYSGSLPQYIVLLFQTPLLLYHIFLEHYRLKGIIRNYNIHIIISDNRFGLWNRSIRSVYVTHMPRIPLPKSLRFLELTGVFLHRFIIKRYSLCLIPDLPGEVNLTGRLSHGLKLPSNVRYVGIISRFISGDPPVLNPVNFTHNTIILSGPQPQKGILRNKLLAALKDEKIPTVILEGKPSDSQMAGKPSDSQNRFNTGKIISFPHLPASEMKEVIKSSDKIITRSGYTTIMDLVSLSCSAMLIPTPGQTEQEYLAEYLSRKDWFATVKQNEINGMTIPSTEAKWSSGLVEESRILLKRSISEILEEPQE